MEILNHPLFILAIVLCIAIEFWLSRNKELSNFSAYESASNLFLIFIDKILGLLTGTDGGVIVQWLWSHRIMELSFSRPVNLLITFIAVEFFYYCNHWYHHHVNLGWATHIMHHSPTKFNLTLGYRLGVTRLFSLGWLVFLPSIVLGLHPQDLALCLGIILLMQFFIHTELVPPLAGWDKFFNTPGNHRIHHSSNQRDYNKNLGGVTMVFDHLFGTYQACSKDEVMDYGMPEVMGKKNVFYEITFHWRKVFKEFVEAKGLVNRLKVLFGAPK